MANWYVDSVDYASVAQWAASHVYTVGSIVRQLASPAVGSERCFRVSSVSGTGTSGSSEPTWATGLNATTTDNAGANQIVWTECTGQETYQGANGSSWLAPAARLITGIARAALTAGDVVFVGSGHAETNSSAVTWTPISAANCNKVICVNKSNVPATEANRTTGATFTTTGNASLLIQNALLTDGLSFTIGSGSTGAASLTFSGTGAFVLRNGGVNLAITSGSTSSVVFGQSSLQGAHELVNFTFTFASTAAFLNVQGNVRWRDTPSAIGGTTFPASLFKPPTSLPGSCDLHGVDLSALGSGKTICSSSTGGFVSLTACKLNSAVTIAATGTTLAEIWVDLIRCDSGTGVYRSERYRTYLATQTIETTIIRTGGATDNSTGISWKITTTANATWQAPFDCFAVSIANSATGSSKIVTMHGIVNAASLPNNDDLWIEVEYFGDASSTLASRKSGTKASAIATAAAIVASTEAWDSLATARANGHTYSIGDVIAVATNPGRLFFCTTGGASAGSEPGGYATAVDGGSVTDNAAVFRAGVRFKLTATLTSPNIALAGPVLVYPRVAKASSTLYLDPRAAIS